MIYFIMIGFLFLSFILATCIGVCCGTNHYEEDDNICTKNKEN